MLTRRSSFGISLPRSSPLTLLLGLRGHPKEVAPSSVVYREKRREDEPGKAQRQCMYKRRKKTSQ